MNDQQRHERDLAEQLARIADPSSPQAVAAAVAFLLTFYVGLALAYRDAIPLFEAPDEPSHLHYATFVFANGRLPRQSPLEVPGEGMQAPLVYVVAAPLLGRTGLDVAWAARELGRAAFPFYSDPKVAGGGPAIRSYEHGYREFATDGSLEPLRVLRTTSLAFGLLTVILTFAAVWRLSRDARFALLTSSLVAFDPQFLFSSGYFGNDPAAAAVGAAALWIIARALEEPDGPGRRHYLAGGALIAVGALTKTSTLAGLAAAAVTLVAIDQRPRRTVSIDAAIAAAIALLLAGPYVVWASEHRGGFLGVNAVVASAVGMVRAEHFGGQLAFLLGIYWDWTLESFWARFGWFNVAVPKATYLAFFALTWTGVLGLIAGRYPLPADALRTRALRAYLLAAFGLTFAGHFAMNLAIVNPQGRLLFPAIAQIAFLLAIGIAQLIGSERRILPITVCVVVALVGLDVYCLRGVLLSAYR
ncbi:MAG TPA: glycosyltransferase family 39 protein [Myxococcota bacterium]|nr:glycosyltransferase family 39 protein [Myxococcota bacterium]